MPPFGGTGRILFGSADVGYGMDGSSLFRSDEGGATWSSVAGPTVSVGSYSNGSLEVGAAGERVVVGGTWRAEPPPGCFGASPFDDTIALCTRWAGGGEGRLPHVAASPERFAVGFRDGTVALTTDGGDTFEYRSLAGLVGPPDDLENATWVSGIAFADEEVAYLATNGRGMWRSDDGGATWQAEPAARELWGLAIGSLAVVDRDQRAAARAGRLGAVLTISWPVLHPVRTGWVRY